MVKINYVIATWPLERVSTKGIDTIDYLKTHIKEFLKYENCLSQVTIVKPPIEHEYYNRAIKYIEKIHCNVEIIEFPHCQTQLSYGQWLFAYQKYNEFDYYIFIEDDYCPIKDNFDVDLIELYNDRHVYLCGLSGEIQYSIHDHRICPNSAAISNGIISQQSMNQAEKLLIKYLSKSTDTQTDFSSALLNSNIDIIDWTDRFKTPFFNTNSQIITEYGKMNEYIIVPIQFITKEYKKIIPAVKINDIYTAAR